MTIFCDYFLNYIAENELDFESIITKTDLLICHQANLLKVVFIDIDLKEKFVNKMSQTKVGNTIYVTVLKSLLIGFNIIFIACGLVITGVSVHMIYTVIDALGQDLSEPFLKGPTAILIIGIIMTSISFCGCFGALRDSIKLLKIYSTFVIIFTLIEIFLLVGAIVKWESFELQVKNNFVDLVAPLRQYKDWLFGIVSLSILCKATASTISCVLINQKKEPCVVVREVPITLPNETLSSYDSRMVAMMLHMENMKRTQQTEQIMRQMY